MEAVNIVIAVIMFGLIISVVVLGILFSKQKEIVVNVQNRASDDINSLRAVFEREKKTIESNHENDVAIIRQEYESRIQDIQNNIENRKEVLKKIEEKELLASIMIALDGYARRFDQIEKSLGEEEITKHIDALLHNATNQIIWYLFCNI